MAKKKRKVDIVAPGYKDPFVVGLLVARWGWPRKPPNWHIGHTAEYKRKWLNGYDSNKCKN